MKYFTELNAPRNTQYVMLLHRSVEITSDIQMYDWPSLTGKYSLMNYYKYPAE